MTSPKYGSTLSTSAPMNIPKPSGSGGGAGGLEVDRPEMGSGRASSFHSRALAISAAHRLASSPSSSSGYPHQANFSTSIPNRPDPESLFPTSSPSSPTLLQRLQHPSFHHHSQGHKGVGVPGETYHWLSEHGDDAAVGGGTGDEPGVDVRSKRDEEAYKGLRGDCHITVVDYSSDPDQDDTNIKVDFEGSRLREWLDSPEGKRGEEGDGRSAGVRWIHVDGINWEVVKCLTLEFGLHPLAVEDALRATNSPRSKLDFYKTHLYLQILVQHIQAGDDELIAQAEDNHTAGSVGHGSSKVPLMQLPEGVEGVFEPSVGGTRLQHEQSPMEKEAHRMTVDGLSAKYMVPIRRGMCSVFMTRDGTLISIMKKSIKEVLKPIYERLEDEQSLLRRSGDVSMLAQALLDVSVDLAIEISQTFETEILHLEASVLVDPSMDTVRHLHVLSSQLIRLRRSLTPLLHLAYIIRDQDTQRSAAASAMSAGPRPSDKNHMSRDTQWLAPGPTSDISRPGTPGASDAMSIRNSNLPVGLHNSEQNQGQQGQQGFFSPKTKVYIGDVLDHLELIVGSLDQFVATCDHLTDYVFNVLSFQTNASMERLSIVTVIFLPLTFISSYFGMNFTGFPEIEGSVTYFWKLAAPLTAAFFIIFSFSYIRHGAETAYRKLGRRRIQKVARNRPVLSRGKSGAE